MPTPERRPEVARPNLVQLLSAQPDWFVVTSDYLPQEKQYRYFIERVLCWTLVRNPDEVDHVTAINGSGTAITTDLCEDPLFVQGCDQSPYGDTWQDIYKSIIPNGANVRELNRSMTDTTA